MLWYAGQCEYANFLMSLRNSRLFLIFVTGMLAVWNFACHDGDNLRDREPPAIPRGVRSITGNNEITIEWFPNSEHDLAGYRIWKGGDGQNFDLLKEVSMSKSLIEQYIDQNAQNGVTYHYAVSAFDINGNESDLSPEEVYDTPRPSGQNVTLHAYDLFPTRSGFYFGTTERGAIDWKDSDIYFAFDEEINVRYLYTDNGTQMQDMGYHEYFEEIDVSPIKGFTTSFIELIEGHVYVLLLPSGNYAKLWLLSVSSETITFDWAYQTDRKNPQLAPPFRTESRVYD